MSLPPIPLPVFDEHMNLSLPTKSANKDNILYYSIYIGILSADIEYAKTKGTTTKNLSNRLFALKKSESRLSREVDEFLRKYNIQKKPIEEQDTNEVFSICKRIHKYRFRLFTRRKCDLFYKILGEENKDDDRLVTLALYNNTFSTFKATRVTTGTSWCGKCYGPYKKALRHQCTMSCIRCNKRECDSGVPNPNTIKCGSCNFLFNTKLCFDGHKKPRADVRGQKSTCDSLKKCEKCTRIYRIESKDFQHICFLDKFCSLCKQRYGGDFHDCCWLPVTEKKKQDMLKKQQKWRLVIFDTETVICDSNGDFIRQYVNCLAYSCICNECLELSPDQPCNSCGTRKRGYFRHNAGEPESIVVDAFLDLLWFDTRFSNAICISHNGARFDEMFFISRLLETGHSPEVVMRGSAILLMDLHSPDRNRIIFKDSYLFLPVALDKMSSAFSLPPTVKKGTYPYYFNIPENYDVILPTLPDAHYYGVKYMTKEKAASFNKWYEENRGRGFDSKNELKEYCECDVLILHLAIAKFISLIMGLYSLNPVIINCTLPSFAFTVIKGMYQKGQVAILPERGFGKVNQSPLAIRQLQWMVEKENRRLQYALKGGEFPVSISGHTYMCDGFDMDSGNVIEILGCWYHGCTECFNSSHPTPLKKNLTFGDLYNSTIERIEKIESCGYKVEIIWEHSIRTDLAKDPVKKAFFLSRKHLLPMSIRDCFVGGRTQARVLRCTVDLKKGEVILHLDVNSLYPNCMIKFEYPEGSPIVRTDYENEEVFLPLEFKGFAKCVLLPPRDLYHPIIPLISSEGKQIYVLCRTCGETKNNEECTHESIEDRVITVSVFSKELVLAMENGYRCMRLLETYHYNRWNTEMFPRYLKKLQKLKMENSGWPLDATTDQKKDEYIEEVWREENILLEKDKICENKPLRTIAKFMCNASFGKLAQKADSTMVKFIHKNSEELIPFLFDESKEITSQRIIGDNYMITYRLRTELITPCQYTNVSYAAIITSHGRMILWEAMQRVGKAVLYYDTDSLIFKAWPGSEQLEDLQGSFLGRWSVEHDAKYQIYDFVAAASKVYAYRMKHVETGEICEIVKCKGVTLDNTSSDIVNFDSLVELVENYVEGDKSKNLTTIRPLITKNPAVVTTVNRKKRLRVVMDKLRTLPDYGTLPFGYKKNIDE